MGFHLFLSKLEPVVSCALGVSVDVQRWSWMSSEELAQRADVTCTREEIRKTCTQVPTPEPQCQIQAGVVLLLLVVNLSLTGAS
jgi:hypothetical protein